MSLIEAGVPPEIIPHIQVTEEAEDYTTLIFPRKFIAKDNVPIEPAHVQTIIAQILEEKARLAKEGINATGQITPMEIAFPPGTKLALICDGYHRRAAFDELGIDDIKAKICTIQRGMDYVIRRQIAESKRGYLVYARINEFIQQLWPYTNLKGRLSPFQTFAIATGKGGPGYSRDTADLYAEARAFAEEECKLWGKTPSEIYSILEQAQGVAPEVIRNTRAQKGGGKRTAITPSHASRIGAVLGDRPELQPVVAQAVLDHNLRAEIAGEMAQALRVADTPEEAIELVRTGQWKIVKRGISEFERRDQAQRKLTQEVGTALNTLASSHPLSLVSESDQSRQLLLGTPSPVTEDQTRKFDTKSLLPKLDQNERVLYQTGDLRRFKELQQEEERIRFTQEFAKLLGIDLNPGLVRGLYPHEHRGSEWIKMAHPNSPLIISCNGSRQGEHGFVVNGVFFVYTENYKGVYQNQKERQENVAVEGKNHWGKRRNGSENGNNNKAKKEANLPTESFSIVTPTIKGESEIDLKQPNGTELPLSDEEAAEQAARFLAANLDALANELTNGHQEPETDRENGKAHRDEKPLKITVIEEEVWVPKVVERPPLTVDALKPHRQYINRAGKRVFFREKREGGIIMVSDLESPGEMRRVRMEDFLEDYNFA